MPSLLTWAALVVASLILLAFLALYTLLILFTPSDPRPSPSESTYLTPNSTSPLPLPAPFTLSSSSSSSSPTPPPPPPTVDLSVIVPAYNESARLGVMLKPALTYLESRPLDSIPSSRPLPVGVEKGSYEILIVDDGSRDGTVETALELARECERTYPGGKLKRGEVKVCRLVRNRGKGGATKHGVLHSSGCRILFVDADGATSFPDLSLLETELDNLAQSQDPAQEPHGLVVGSRAHLVSSEAVVKRSPLRNLLMRSFHLYLSLLGLSTIRDTQCGFKLQTRATASLLYPALHSPGWIFDCELLLLAMRCGVPVREVGVEWHEVEGSKLDVVRDSVRMARDLLVIRGNYLFGRWKTPGKVDVEVAPEQNGKAKKEL